MEVLVKTLIFLYSFIVSSVEIHQKLSVCWGHVTHPHIQLQSTRTAVDPDVNVLHPHGDVPTRDVTSTAVVCVGLQL